jgi:hypothetical protein
LSFFTPASGKIHIETIMKSASSSTIFAKPGRSGEPLHLGQKAGRDQHGR